MRTSLSICLAIASASSTSLGQTVSIDSGTKVRVTTVGFESSRQIGTLLSANKDSVVFLTTGMPVATTLPTARVKRLEVASGTHSHKWRGFLIGFAVAGIVGGGLEAANWKKSNNEFDFGRWGDAAFVGVASTLAGSLIGLLIGAPASETWKTIPLPQG